MITLLKERRSIRKYKDDKIEKDKVELLKKAILLSPSSRNLKPLSFVFLENQELIEKLSLAKSHGSSFLNGAPLAVIVVGDETKSDVWIEDGSIASIILQLQAEKIGLKSCWIQIRLRMKDEQTSSEEYIKNVLGISSEKKVLSMIAIGYPDEQKPAYDDQHLDQSQITHLE